MPASTSRRIARRPPLARPAGTPWMTIRCGISRQRGTDSIIYICRRTAYSFLRCTRSTTGRSKQPRGACPLSSRRPCEHRRVQTGRSAIALLSHQGIRWPRRKWTSMTSRPILNSGSWSAQASLRLRTSRCRIPRASRSRTAKASPTSSCN